MSPAKPLMYAELLSNIRQISVIVALEEPCDLTTKVELSADGRRFILHYDGEKSSLGLPGRVPPSFQLPNPVYGARELTWRLPLAGQPTRPSLDTMLSNNAPWSAKRLGEDLEFMCRACGVVIVKRGTIRTWKDLPSENWAEMMDFWHCHKPDVPVASDSSPADEGVEHSAANRGYGAHTKFAPSPGIGFVDLTNFLLSERDLQNIQTDCLIDEPLRYQSISCQLCHGYIGYIDQQAAGSRLYKWRLRSTPTSQLTSKSTSPCSSTLPSLASVIGAQLEASMKSQGLSRFVLLPAWGMKASQGLSQQCHDPSCSRNGLLTVSPTSPSVSSPASINSRDISPSMDNRAHCSPTFGSWHSTSLNLWILTPSLKFSSNTPANSTSHSPSGSTESLWPNEADSGTLAMKVFWKKVTVETAETLAEGNGVEEILLPSEAICEIESCLESTSLFLPPTARRFQNWDVGLLDRYEE